MRRSKARDLSEHAVPLDPLHLPEYPFRLSVIPRNGRDLRRLNLDFSYLEPLGKFGRQLLAAFVAICRDLDRKGWEDMAQSLRRFLNKLPAKSHAFPAGWTSEQWKAFADSTITDTFSSPGHAEGTKNLHRAHVRAFLKAAFNAKIIPRFKLRPAIKNPESMSKLPIAQAPVDQHYPADASGEDAAAVIKLEALKDINNPDIHRQRHEILLKLLIKHSENKLRAAWSHYRSSQAIIRDKDGLYVKEFVKLHVDQRSQPILITEKGYNQLRTRKDYLRFLAHPTIFEEFLYGRLPRRLKARLRRKAGLDWFHNALHLTPSTASNCEALFLIDFNNEVSSVLTMTRGDFNVTEEKRVVRVGWYKGRSHERQEDYRERGNTNALREGSTLRISSFVIARIMNVMRQRLKKFAPEKSKDHLFLVSYHAARAPNIANVLSMNRANLAAHELRREHPILARHHFSFDKLRGSIVFDEFLATGDIVKTKEKAKHRNIETTRRYINHAAADIRSVEYVRELQDLLVLSLPAHDVIRQRLSINDARAQTILAKAEATGFLQWRTSAEPAPREVELQSGFSRFLASGEFLYFEDTEVAAEIFAYRRHLLAEAGAIRGSSAWLEFWAPLLLMLNVAWNLYPPDMKLEAERLAEEFQIEYMDAA